MRTAKTAVDDMIRKQSGRSEDRKRKGLMSKSATAKVPKGTSRSTAQKNLHVIPRSEKWAVVSEGSSRATSVFDTQTEAIEAARKLAKDSEGQLVVHGRNGRIRERDHYGRDPFPPREPRKVLHPSAPPRTRKRGDISKAVSQAVRESRS